MMPITKINASEETSTLRKAGEDPPTVRTLLGLAVQTSLAVFGLVAAFWAPLGAQVSQRGSLRLGIGAGWTDGTDSFRGSTVYSLRFGVGSRLMSGLGLDVAGELVRGIGQGDPFCAGNASCPAPFSLLGASVSALLDLGRSGNGRLRTGIGVGVYRVNAKDSWVPAVAPETALGVIATVSYPLIQRAHRSLAANSRVILLPSVGDGRVWWFTPIELQLVIW